MIHSPNTLNEPLCHFSCVLYPVICPGCVESAETASGGARPRPALTSG